MTHSRNDRDIYIFALLENTLNIDQWDRIQPISNLLMTD